MTQQTQTGCSQPDIQDPDPCLDAHVLATPSGQRVLLAPAGASGGERSTDGTSISTRVVDVARDRTDVLARMYVLGIGEWIAAARTESLADRR